MRFLTVIFAFLIFVPAFAQDTLPKKKEPRRIYFKPLTGPKDSVFAAGPNEISLNLSPMIITTLGGAPGGESRFSLFYKHAVDSAAEKAWRVGVLYRPRGNTFFEGGDPWYFSQTDSTRIRNEFSTGTAAPWQLSVGFEWRSKNAFKKRLSGFLSVDLMAGMYNRRYAIYDYVERLDSTGQWKLDFQSSSGITLAAEAQALNWYVGVNPNVGVRYAFSSHWLVFLQTGVDLAYGHHEAYTRGGQGTYLELHEGEALDFDLWGMFNEFAVVYRF